RRAGVPGPGLRADDYTTGRTGDHRGRDKTTELHETMVVAVPDSGGNLASPDRMDGRGPTWDTFAIGKAMGALSTRRPTRDFAPLIDERPDRYFGTLATLGHQVYMVN